MILRNLSRPLLLLQLSPLSPSLLRKKDNSKASSQKKAGGSGRQADKEKKESSGTVTQGVCVCVLSALVKIRALTQAHHSSLTILLVLTGKQAECRDLKEEVFEAISTAFKVGVSFIHVTSA